MAIWQVDFHLVRASDDLPALPSDGWIPPLLPAPLVARARDQLSAYLGPPWTMAEDWVVFGPENGSRIDVAYEPHGMASVVIRFDVRNDGVQFPLLVCKMAKTLGCLLFSPDTGLIAEPDTASLVQATGAAHKAVVLRGLKIG